LEMPAGNFFVGPMMTALPPTACLTAVRFPVWSVAAGERIGVGFREVNARQSDFAFAAAAAQIVLDGNGICRRLALGIGAVTPVPLRLEHVGEALMGGRLEEAAVRRAVTDALAAIEPLADLHASANYRRRAALALAVRAVADACQGARA
jgi:CO/xanthine dehydrogenase FAD-binding subunit